MVNALELFEAFKNNQAQRALAEAKLRLAPLQEQAAQFALTKGAHDIATEDAKLGMLARQQKATEDFNNARLGVMAQAAQARGLPKPTAAPAGYRLTANGNLEAIPGGPADTKLQGQYNTDVASLQGLESSLDRLNSQIDLVKSSNLGRITGITGALPNVPGSEGSDAKARLDALKSQIGMNMLNEMKALSRTGASGLGSVTESEHKLLQAQLGNLSQAQSEREIRQVLDNMSAYVIGARARIRNAFNMKHGDKQVPTQPETPPDLKSLLDKYK